MHEEMIIFEELKDMEQKRSQTYFFSDFKISEGL